MLGLSPKDKGQAESVDSSPRASKRVKRHLTPPRMTRPGGHYKSSDEKVLKGPKVIKLLRTIIEMPKEHKKLNDQVAELSLELASLRDEYNTLRRGLCSKMQRLAKDVEKGNE
jgi:hypothetical protein